MKHISMPTYLMARPMAKPAAKPVVKDRFFQHMSRYIGETVTVITRSGGQSGLGFTGALLAVNSCFIRLITQIGSVGCFRQGNHKACRIGSIIDIPIDKISAFIHNNV